MPLYTYQCQQCGLEMDRTFRMNDFPREIECIRCNGKAKKVIVSGHGGIQTDGDVPWLPSACMTLQTSRERREKPIETRTEWKKTMKEKGLIPVG